MRCLLLVAVVFGGACEWVFGLDARSTPDGPPLAVDGPPDAHPSFGSLAPVALACPPDRSPIDVTLDEQERRFLYGCTALQGDIYEAEVENSLKGGPATAVVVSTTNEGSPELSPDGLSVYYLVLTTGIGRIDLKQRAAIEQPWGATTSPAGINTVADDRPGSPDATGDHIVLTRSSPPSSVLIEVVRTRGAWLETDMTAAFMPLMSPIDPHLSADGRTLVFAAMGQGFDLFIAQR